MKVKMDFFDRIQERAVERLPPGNYIITTGLVITEHGSAHLDDLSIMTEERKYESRTS